MSDLSCEQAGSAPAERGEKSLEARWRLVGLKRVKDLIDNAGKTAEVEEREKKKKMNYTRALTQHNSPTLNKQTHDRTRFLCKC